MLVKIISGGQTGADEGGLEGAYQLGIATGGTAPKGYRTEKGSNLLLKTRYGLVEDDSSQYPPRTRKNAHNSDGTVWFGNIGSPGYWCTRSAAIAKPWIENPTPQTLTDFVYTNNITVLNVAGNRESKNPGLYELVKHIIITTFGTKS